MNKVILMGRLTRDPDIRYSQGDKAICVARYTLAVDRKFKHNADEAAADFISCVSFSKTAEFVEQYLKQGTKITCCGRLQTGSYTNKEGIKVYTTDVVVEEIAFAESKRNSQNNESSAGDGFVDIPDGIGQELPFN